MKDKNTLDLGTIDELEDRHDIPLAKVKKLMETRPIIREKGEEFTLLSIPMEIEFKALLDNLDVEFRRRVIEGIPGITFQVNQVMSLLLYQKSVAQIQLLI